MSFLLNWANFRECHILPDWLLVYQIYDDVLVLSLARTGSHSDIFKLPRRTLRVRRFAFHPKRKQQPRPSAQLPQLTSLSLANSAKTSRAAPVCAAHTPPSPPDSPAYRPRHNDDQRSHTHTLPVPSPASSVHR